MVDIIRRKNVNLESPDVSSGTKATANAVRTIGSGIGSAMQKYGARLEREQEKADKEYTAEVQQNLKEAQTRLVNEQKAFDASDKIVAADMAGRLENDLLRWNLEQRAKNPNYIGTAEHEKRMRDEYARLSNMYGQGLGEAGREEFTKKTQSTVNDFIGNDVKWAYKQKLKAGENSAKNIAETMNKAARVYGANGDVDGFKEAHKQSRDNLAKYAKKMGMQNADKALAEFDIKSATDYLKGLSETDPMSVIEALGDKETLIKSAKEVAQEDDTGDLGRALWGIGKVARRFIPGGEFIDNYILQHPGDEEKWYKESGLEQSGREKFLEILPDEYKQTIADDYVKAAETQMAELKQQQSHLAKGSHAYKSLTKQMNDLQATIDNPDDIVADVVRDKIKETVLPEARKNLDLHKLAEQELQQQQVVETYTMSMSPDKDVADAANFALALGQPTAEQLFNMSITPEAMHKAWERYKENNNKVKFNTMVEFDATEAVADGLSKIRDYQGNNPLEVIKYALDVQADLAESANMTESQKDNVQTILYAAVQDKAFGDVVSSVLSSENRYFPDTSWYSNIFRRADMPLYDYSNGLTAGGVEYDLQGLVSSNIGRQDIDSVQDYLKTETVRVTNDVMGLLAVAAKEPDMNKRAEIAQEAANYLATEKRKVYDTAMKSYGIDLQRLREVKKEKGHAYTQIGSQLKEYLGDDPSTGEPLWGDYWNSEQANFARKRILDGLKATESEGMENGK